MAKTRKQKDEEASVKKAAAKQLAQKRKSAQASPSKGAPAGSSKHAIFDLDLVGHNAVPEFSEGVGWDTPFVARDSALVKELSEGSPCRLNLL
eukprot:12362842-Alexandrium_andersonii.AAC.1